MKCYCCSGEKFADCCQPFIVGAAKPTTAQALMRSRYTAYATGAVEYIIKTTHPSTRKFHDAETIENWARANVWQKLEIIRKTDGAAKDKKGTVEFKAYFLDAENNLQTHHELSNFRAELGKWFFVDGRIIETKIMKTDEKNLRDLYDAFNRRDVEAVLAMMADDVKWANGMEGGFVDGRDNVREYWRRQFEMFNPQLEILESKTDESRSVVKLRQIVRDLSGNLLDDKTVEHIFTFDENGLIKLFEIGDSIKPWMEKENFQNLKNASR